MAAKSKFTDELFAAVPGLVAEGKDVFQIASSLGVAASSLKVMCSKRKISLRRPSSPPKPGTVPRRTVTELQLPTSKIVAVDRYTIEGLRRQAIKMETTHAELAGRLLEAIVRDDLFNAVLDA